MRRPRPGPLSVSIFALITCLACDPEDLDPELDAGVDAACDEEDAAATAAHPLVFAQAWTESPADHDPVPEHRPREVICPSSAFSDEFGVLEASTGSCNYFALEQPLAEDLARGDRLRVQVWWSGLLAPEPGEGHLALFVDGEALWEVYVPIPSPAQARSFEFRSPVAAEAGARVSLHLHNHGQNSWTLAAVERIDSICE